MKKLLALLLVTTIAISACKKETPKKTLVEELPGRNYQGIRGDEFMGRHYTYYTNMEFKPNNEFTYYETNSDGSLRYQKTTMRWEPLNGSGNKIKLWMYPNLDYVTGDIAGDSLVTNYQGDAYLTYKLITK